MNNACPDCGAVYAVAVKDIGRKIKCKKCGASLRVAEKGLVEDTGGSAPPAAEEPAVAVAAAADDEGGDFDTGDDEVVSRRGNKKGGGGRRDKGPTREHGASSFNINEILGKVGGIPTLLFGFGVFLVIWYTFMSKIGEAAVERAAAAPQKLKLEMDSRAQEKLPKGKTEFELSADEEKNYREEKLKLLKEYTPKINEANQDTQNAELSNKRSKYFDRYGTMFGFMFLAFGCIGYLLSAQALTTRIVAGAILGVMMIVVFAGGGEKSSSSSSTISFTSPQDGMGGVGGKKGGGPGGP